MAESLKNKTIKGSFWSFADNIIRTVISFFVGIILARLITPGEYGQIGIISIFLSIFNTIVDSGFSNALIRKKDATDLDYNTVFIINLGVSISLFILMFLCAPAIGRFFEQPELIPLTRVMSVVVLINALAIIQRTILVKKVDFKTQTKISFIASVTSGVTGICLAFLGFGVWTLVVQNILAGVLTTGLLWMWSHWFPKFKFSKASFKELFGFGWKLLLSSLINTLWNNIYQVVIGKCYSHVTLGQYSRAHQFADLPSSNLTSVVQRVTYPVLSSIGDDKIRLKSAYKRVIKVTMLLSFTMMLGMAAVAKPMILVLVGEQWLPCVIFLQLICFNMMLYPLHALNLNMLQVQGRSDLFLKLEIYKKILAVWPVLMGIFVNIYAMLLGSVINGFIAYYLNAYYSGPYLNYSIWEQIKDILPSFGVAIIMAAIVFAMSFIPISPFILLPIQLIAGVVIVYILCSVFKLEEFIELKNILFSYIKKKS